MKHRHSILRALLLGLIAVAVAVALPALGGPTPDPKQKPMPFGDCSGEGDRFGCCAYQKSMCMDMCTREQLGPGCFDECERSFAQCLYGS